MNEQETCLWFESNLNAYLDGELDREARGRMDEHARSCPDCGQKLETMTRLLTMCAELDEGLAVPLSAQAAWREAIRAEAQSRGRTRRVGAWTRSMGWIAAALTLLTVSTALFGQDVIAPPAQVEVDGQGAAGAAYSAPRIWRADGVQGGDAGTLSITADGAIEGSEGTAGQQTVVDSASEREQVVLRSASYAIATAAFDTDSQNIDNLVDEYDAYYESDSQSGQPIGAGRSDGRQRTMLIACPPPLDEFLTVWSDRQRHQQDPLRVRVSANYNDAAAHWTRSRRACADRKADGPRRRHCAVVSIMTSSSSFRPRSIRWKAASAAG
jgi:anti-sigma factor RsiW